MAILNVGDNVYVTNWARSPQLYGTVSRVTEKRAFVKKGSIEVAFVRDYGNKPFLRKLGKTDSWTSETYYPETMELKNKARKEFLVDSIKKAHLGTLPVEALESIHSTIQGYEQSKV